MVREIPKEDRSFGDFAGVDMFGLCFISTKAKSRYLGASHHGLCDS